MDIVKAFRFIIATTLLICVFSCTKLQVQPIANPTSSGIRFYGNSYGNTLQSFEATADGGFIFCGNTGTSDSNETQGYLQKTDKNGNIVWYKTYGGAHLDAFNTAHETSDGGYIVAGATSSYGFGSSRKDYFYDAWLVKTDANGDTLWQKTYGDIYSDRFYDVAETADHDFVAVGINTPPPYTYSSTYVVKTDQNGKIVWLPKQFFGTTTFYYSLGASVTLDPDGNIAIAGCVSKSTAAADLGKPYPAFILLSPDGKNLDFQTASNPYPQYKAWGTMISGLPGNYAYTYNIEKIVSRPDGYIFVINLSAAQNSVMLFKVNTKGNIIGSPHQFFGLGSASVNAVTDNAAGGLLISGGTTDASKKNYCWLLNTDPNGNNLWESTLPVTGYNAWAAGAVAVGNYFAIGVNLISTDAKHINYFAFLKMDQNGKIIENNK